MRLCHIFFLLFVIFHGIHSKCQVHHKSRICWFFSFFPMIAKLFLLRMNSITRKLITIYSCTGRMFAEIKDKFDGNLKKTRKSIILFDENFFRKLLANLMVRPFYFLLVFKTFFKKRAKWWILIWISYTACFTTANFCDTNSAEAMTKEQ